ncbi:MAG: BACON domain-containing protein, partial [Candidatus Zixiibacteriota bacterium]
MSARDKRYSFLILALLMAGAAVILTCSDKILNSDPGNAIEFDMALKFGSAETQALAEVVTTYRVTIIADEDTITANLEYSNGNITGLIENVPAGPNRTIIVEGLAADGTVLYRGSVVIEVIAGQTVDAVVTLRAVARLARVSPRFINEYLDKSFLCELKVANIIGLDSIGFTLYFNPTVVKIDSFKAGANLPEGADFYFDNESSGYIETSVLNSFDIVDSSGNASIARIFFSAVSSNRCLDSTDFDLSVVYLIAPGITIDSVYVDDGEAIINRGRLLVSPDTLRFGYGVEGLNLDFKQVNISDSCGNNVAYTISATETWIDLNTALAGITPGSIFIDVNPTGLASGSYEGKVLVTWAKSVNSPYEIVIKLSIDRGVRSLCVVPKLIIFNALENGALPTTRQVRVEDCLGFNISFNAAEDASWLAINKTSGTTPDSVAVSITTTALAPGTYTDTVVLSSEVANNSPQYVTIQYSVGAVAKFLDVIPDTLYFSALENDDPPPSQNFRVIETGGYNIAFNATENASWLALSGISGTTPDTITAQILTTEMEAGIYYADITVSGGANNSPQKVVVKYEIIRGARIIATDKTNIHFAIEQNGP